MAIINSHILYIYGYIYYILGLKIPFCMHRTYISLYIIFLEIINGEVLFFYPQFKAMEDLHLLK